MEMGSYLILLMMVSFILLWSNTQLTLPWLSVVNRWMRWGVFSFVLAYFLSRMEGIDKPFWVLAVIGALSWMLLETIYTWVGLGLLSRSEVPLFPSFRRDPKGFAWPSQKRFIEVKDEVKAMGFQEVEALSSKIIEGVVMRSFVYEHPETKVRLQIVFMPRKDRNFSVNFVVSSSLKSGGRFITDNIFMPFGGYYPSNWSVVRKPLVGSLGKLIALHEGRLRVSGECVVSWEEDVVFEMNGQQRLLQSLNTERRFLVPANRIESDGKLTNEGRYRIWKEIWLMNYFGCSSSS